MCDVTLDMVFVPSNDVVAREIEGDLVIVPLTAGIGDADDELYTLNATGQAIWRELDGRRTLADVSANLLTKFDCSRAELEADVVGFVGELLRRGILTTRG